MMKLHEQGKLPAEQSGCFLLPRPAEELYDVLADPHQLRNLWADPAHATALNELRAALRSWQQETADVPPAQLRPDEFDRRTGDRLSDTGGKKPKKKK
jgi:hypothetical protein